jgi:hypothetical protein
MQRRFVVRLTIVSFALFVFVLGAWLYGLTIGSGFKLNLARHGFTFRRTDHPSLPDQHVDLLAVEYEVATVAKVFGGPIGYTAFTIRYWFLLLLSGALPAVWFWKWHRHARRQAAGQCDSCGYDLRASADRCPECGTAIPARAEAILS